MRAHRIRDAHMVCTPHPRMALHILATIQDFGEVELPLHLQVQDKSDTATTLRTLLFGLRVVLVAISSWHIRPIGKIAGENPSLSLPV